MKKGILVLSLALLAIFIKPATACAQGEEIAQLLLNVEKLAQFKKILQNIYDGYKIIHKGYTAVKDISEGNFNLHKTFLEGLLEVSPAVKKYKRITDIISYQARIVKEYKAAFFRFKSEKGFSPKEILYIGQVHARLVAQTAKSMEALLLVITAGKLRMSDAERLQAIDRIYAVVIDQFSFLREFNNNTALLALQRNAEQTDIQLSRTISGLK